MLWCLQIPCDPLSSWSTVPKAAGKNDCWMPTAAPCPGEDLAPHAAAGSLCSLPLAQRASRSGSGLGKPAGGLHALSALRPPGDCAGCGGHTRQLRSGGTLLQSFHPHGFNCFQWRSCPGEKHHSLRIVFGYIHAGSSESPH